MDDQRLGVVQTPHFFQVVNGQTWVECAAGAATEVFYRSVQQTRDRFNSALCVGSNGVYPRIALSAADGFTLIPHAEDSPTGLDIRHQYYELKYPPIPVAATVCLSTIDLFIRQQYRWCNGTTSLTLTSHMWRVKIPLKARLPYLAGWLWKQTTAVRTLILPLIPISLLVFLPGEVQLRNGIHLVPSVISGASLYPLWHSTRWPIDAWRTAIAIGWAQALAIRDYSRDKVITGVRGPGDATRRFRKAVLGWNGTLALGWVGLAAWRGSQTGSSHFPLVAGFGISNLAVIGRVIFPARKHLDTMEDDSVPCSVPRRSTAIYAYWAGRFNFTVYTSQC